jgi:putative membrane protein|tara:strand:- start:1988 stop:2968 length:981 start_codon:yes stop_codon:yes gene_type:complete
VSESESLSKPRAHFVKIFVIGLVMGAAEVVPGVSGGTIAFITGIYLRLITAIQRFTPFVFRDLFKDGIAATWLRLDINFLLTLLAGMLTSVLLFASGIHYLLDNHPIFIWSLFFGLVVASVWLVAKQITRFGWDLGLYVLSGAAFGLMVSNILPVELSPSPLYLFVAGAIAICAWILPGLSGSYLLLIFGLYRGVIEAIKNFDIEPLFYLGMGMLLGIVTFARILDRLFRNYRDATLSLLTGFMLGSLAKLWPWQYVRSYQIKPDGSQVPLVSEPVTPMAYSAMTGLDSELLMALLGLVVGLGCVVLLAFLSVTEAESKDAAEKIG